MGQIHHFHGTYLSILNIDLLRLIQLYCASMNQSRIQLQIRRSIMIQQHPRTIKVDAVLKSETSQERAFFSEVENV